MMKVTQSLVLQLANVSALHLLFFRAQRNTILYFQLIEILNLNPYLLYLNSGYVSKERISFAKDHIITSILQHGDRY